LANPALWHNPPLRPARQDSSRKPQSTFYVSTFSSSFSFEADHGKYFAVCSTALIAGRAKNYIHNFSDKISKLILSDGDTEQFIRRKRQISETLFVKGKCFPDLSRLEANS
jgi:hypothetical protein